MTSLNPDNCATNCSSGDSWENELTSSSVLSKLYRWEDYIVAVYLLIVGVVSVLLNGLVVYICLRRIKHLIACDYYIFNLAIVDIMMPIVGFPLTVSASFQHEWVIGEHMCAAYGFIGFVCGLISINILAAISYIRYVKVCGINGAAKITENRKLLTSGIYVYSACWAFLPIFGVGAYGPESYGTSCCLEWHGHTAFVTLFFIICVLFPVIIMSISYGRILFHIRQSSTQHSTSLYNGPFQRILKKRESYLIKMTLAMCVGFVGLWSPYAVVSLLTAYSRHDYVPIRVTLVTVLLAKLSTVVNPIVYFILNGKFRPVVRKVIAEFLDNIKSKIGFT